MPITKGTRPGVGATGPAGVSGPAGVTGPVGVTGATIAAGAWTALPLGTGWTAYGGGWQTPQYRKVGDIVYVRGLIHGGASSTSSLWTALPAGHASPASLIVSVPSANAYANRLDLGGGAGTYSGTTNIDWVSISGICWSVV